MSSWNMLRNCLAAHSCLLTLEVFLGLGYEG